MKSDTERIVELEQEISKLRAQEIGIKPGTPASAAAAGTKGQIRWDSGFLYVCVATNTWKRATLATW